MRLLREFWGWIFLGLTTLVVGLELFAAFGPGWATTWTEYIVTYVPVEAAVALWGMAMSWLLYHFWAAYRRKHRDSEEPMEPAECPWCDQLPAVREDCCCALPCDEPWCPQTEISA